MNYFFDTSALVKIYHIENGSDTVLRIYESDATIFITELSKIEFISTIHRKYREKEIDINTLDAVIAKFVSDVRNKYILLRHSSMIIDEAWNLIKKYSKEFSFRTLDSLQLSFFKTFCEEKDIFVCSDKRFIKIIEIEGIAVIVPD